MFPEKIKITDELIQLIINTRKNDHLTAYQLSEKIGKNKSWLPNIENKRTKNISKSDLYLLFKDNAAKENMSPEQYILRNLPRNCTIELEDGITAPCYHVREMLGISYLEDYENLSKDEFNEELDFNEYGRNDKLREKDVAATIYRLSNTLIDKLKLYTLEEKENFARCLDTMTDNFENDFEHTISIYNNSYCPADPLSKPSSVRTDYISYLETLDKNNNIALNMMSSRAFVYSFIEQTPYDTYTFFNKIKNWNNIDEPEEEKLYFAFYDIKNFQFAVFSYAEYLTEYSTIFKKCPTFDYALIFSKLFEAFKLFIQVAKMNYSFDLFIPNDNSSIEKIHQKTDKIIFDIEKEMRLRYRSHDSLWY